MSPWLSDLYLRAQSDARLLSLARDGHDRAFAVLAERYRDELLGQARRLSATGNAEDLVQQTLLSAFAALRRGAEVGHARGWLHAILRHAAIRAHAPIEAPLEAAVDALVAHDTLLETRADARELLSALDELPARQREALVGSTMQGLSRAELAASLGVSEGAVRQLVHRARMAVRAAVTAATPYQLARWLSDTASSPGNAPGIALGGGAAGAGGLLAKLGMVAAAGAIAAGGTVVATGHGARHTGPHPRTATIAAATDPALRPAAGRTVARTAVIDVKATSLTGGHGAGGRRDAARGRSSADAGRLASGQTRSGPGSGGRHQTSDGGGLRALTGSGSSGGRDGGALGSRGGGADRTASQTGGAGSASGSAPRPTRSRVSSTGSQAGDSENAAPAAVPASAGPGTTPTGTSGAGALALGTRGVNGSAGSGAFDRSGGSTASVSGDGGRTSTH